MDEVITDAPYAITDQFLNRLFHEYNIDYVIHGDDPCLLPDGTDAYAAAKKAGRYKQIKRTEGVSSTDIVGTIFLFLYQKKTKSSVNIGHIFWVVDGKSYFSCSKCFIDKNWLAGKAC